MAALDFASSHYLFKAKKETPEQYVKSGYS